MYATSEEQGWSGYYDGSDVMGDLVMAMSGLDYRPSLADVGHGQGYFPGDVSEDARALNFLGFLPDDFLAELRPSTGSQKDDMSASAGAWAPGFRTAVKDFQSAKGLTPDGWIGPNTRARIAAAVTVKNASESPIAPPFIPPPPGVIDPPAPAIIVPPISPPAPAKPGAAPAAKAETPWLLYGGIAAGVLLLGGLAYSASK
jgi:hypothetical protein